MQVLKVIVHICWYWHQNVHLEIHTCRIEKMMSGRFIHCWKDVYSAATGHIKHFNINIQYSGDPLEMVSENKQLKTFDQLFQCYKVVRFLGTSDEVTPISSSLERGTEIAHVEEDSLCFGTSKLVCDWLYKLDNTVFFWNCECNVEASMNYD